MALRSPDGGGLGGDRMNHFPAPAPTFNGKSMMQWPDGDNA